jgi:hypothetical protein
MLLDAKFLLAPVGAVFPDVLRRACGKPREDERHEGDRQEDACKWRGGEAHGVKRIRPGI